MLDPAVALVSASLGATATAFVAWRKTGPEREALTVKTLRSVLVELRAELDHKDREMEVLRNKLELAEATLEKLTNERMPSDFRPGEAT